MEVGEALLQIGLRNDRIPAERVCRVVEPRRQSIEKNAKCVTNLDV